MKKEKIIAYTCLGALLCALVLPLDLAAVTGNFADAGKHLQERGDSIMTFAYGPVMRFAGIFSFAYGIIMWILGGSFSSVASFLIGGASTSIAPTILNAILPASTTLLP